MADSKQRPAYVILYAAVAAAVFTGGIMTLHQVARPVVERNQRLLRQRALVDLFDLGDPAEMSAAEVSAVVESQIDQTQSLTDPQTNEKIQLLVARDGDGGLIGYAFGISGLGYWARIDGLLAVTPDLKRTIGVVFLAHSETPGLGGRITEPEFRDQFAGGARGGGLRVSPPAEQQPYLYVGGEKPSSGRNPRYDRVMDSLTGATQTSVAIGRFLNAHLARFHRAAEAARLGANGGS